MLHINYTKILPAIAPEGAKFGVMKKLAFDQTVFASYMMGSFFVLINVLEGHGVTKGLSDLREKYWTTMLVNWQLWIPASAINFSVMPIKFQVLFANFVALIFNTCLSYIHNKPAAVKAADPENNNS